MKKVKRIWQENKVLLVLAIILLVCIIIFAIVAMRFFYGTNNNVYGNRLNATKETPISDKLLKEIKDTVEKDETVKEVKTTLKGRVLYISIEFNSGVKMEDAKLKADAVLPLFNDDELNIYDLEFAIISKEKDNEWTLMGARNSSGSGKIVWNNKNIEIKEEEKKEEKKKDSDKA